MGKIAFFADLHGNLPALRAILSKIDSLHVDRIISLGDNIGIGPHPMECLELLREREVTSVMGNHEEYQLKEELPPGMAKGERLHQLWVRKRLTPDGLTFLRTFPYRITLPLGSQRVLFFHSPHRSDPGGNTRFINVRHMEQDERCNAFWGWEEDIFCFGHSHLFMDWSDGKRFINPGSVGCHKGAFARFSLLEGEGRDFCVTHFQVPYDRSSVLVDLEALEVPEREFIGRNFF
ncbi:MAG: metallophosphoesterase family protein [Spirochaetales bacterium]|nr:metallophosphoesterase family protein [Spirochaetales bacterium]